MPASFSNLAIRLAALLQLRPKSIPPRRLSPVLSRISNHISTNGHSIPRRTSPCQYSIHAQHASQLNTLIMAPKKNAAAAPAPSIVPPSTAKPAHGQTSASSQPTKPLPAAVKPTSVKSTVRNSSDAQEIALAVWDRYVQDTPQRVKLIDVFMTFLILVGVLQFLYCVIGGNYVRPSPLVASSISG